MAEEGLKVGDTVLVNERSSISGEILKHEWEGKIVWISKDGRMANVQDLDEDGGLFWRDTRNLEKSDRSDCSGSLINQNKGENNGKKR